MRKKTTSIILILMLILGNISVVFATNTAGEISKLKSDSYFLNLIKNEIDTKDIKVLNNTKASDGSQNIEVKYPGGTTSSIKESKSHDGKIILDIAENEKHDSIVIDPVNNIVTLDGREVTTTYTEIADTQSNTVEEFFNLSSGDPVSLVSSSVVTPSGYVSSWTYNGERLLQTNIGKAIKDTTTSGIIAILSAFSGFSGVQAFVIEAIINQGLSIIPSWANGKIWYHIERKYTGAGSATAGFYVCYVAYTFFSSEYTVMQPAQKVSLVYYYQGLKIKNEDKNCY